MASSRTLFKTDLVVPVSTVKVHWRPFNSPSATKLLTIEFPRQRRWLHVTTSNWSLTSVIDKFPLVRTAWCISFMAFSIPSFMVFSITEVRSSDYLLMVSIFFCVASIFFWVALIYFWVTSMLRSIICCLGLCSFFKLFFCNWYPRDVLYLAANTLCLSVFVHLIFS